MSNIFMALLPFRNPTTSEMAYFGDGVSYGSPNFTLQYRAMVFRAPYHTTWYLHCCTTYANPLNCFTEHPLLMFRVANLHLREVFLAWAISLTTGFSYQLRKLDSALALAYTRFRQRPLKLIEDITRYIYRQHQISTSKLLAKC